jgi:hypothetical protein
MPIGFITQPEWRGIQVEATFDKMSGSRGFAIYKAHEHGSEELKDPIIYVPVSDLPRGKHPTRILVSISAPEDSTWGDHKVLQPV